jgi:hypothetical protein
MKRVLAPLCVGVFVLVGIPVAAEDTSPIFAGAASLWWDASLTSATMVSADSRFSTEYFGAPATRTNADGSIDFSSAIPFTNAGNHPLAQVFHGQTFAAWLAGSMTIRTEPVFLPPAAPEGAERSFTTTFTMSGTITAYASRDHSGEPFFSTDLTGSGTYTAGPYHAVEGRWVRKHLGADVIRFASGVPTSNIALNRPMFASSSFDPTVTPERAVDGDASTWWSSEFSDPQWIAVDLGGVFSIDRVVLNWEAAYAAEYQLLFSDDGQHWRLALTKYDATAGVDDFQVSVIGRYVGVNSLRRGTPDGYSLSELEVYGTPATNHALNKLAVASSSFDANFTPNLAVDGDPSTRWSSVFDSPEWIAVDLGRFLQINRIVLNWEDAFASQYMVMLSDDGLLWRMVAVRNDDAPGVDQFEMAEVARYIGVYGAVRATPYGYSLWEIEAYGGAVP